MRVDANTEEKENLIIKQAHMAQRMIYWIIKVMQYSNCIDYCSGFKNLYLYGKK